MGYMCEVCGKYEGEVSESAELMAETLHVCEACRNDRHTPPGSVGGASVEW
jgi:hypothetical protein